jgi:transposase
LDDNNPTRNHRNDPKTIAMLVKNGRHMSLYIPERIYSDMWNDSNSRCRLGKQLNSIRNRVERGLSDIAGR